jgi:hypothetical protein
MRPDSDGTSLVADGFLRPRRAARKQYPLSVAGAAPVHALLSTARVPRTSLLLRRLAVLALVVSCGATKATTDSGVATDGRPADVAGGGGAGGDGGTSPDVRADTATDAAERSAGSVTLQLTVSSMTPYCDEGTTCGFPQHIFIRDPAGRTLTTALPFCQTTCSAECRPAPCPGIACVPMATRFTDERVVWSGVYYEGAQCGAGVPCSNQRFAPPGRYVAVMCATPGTLSDGGTGVCIKEAQRCVEVPFDFPSPTLVEGRLM